jgi:PAS domain S-box-containing protein
MGGQDLMSNGKVISEKSSGESSALEELRRRERELSDFIENASVGLHWVGADGIILWANQAELDLLGYTREEYIGRHIAEFHADEEVIKDILDVSRVISGKMRLEVRRPRDFGKLCVGGARAAQGIASRRAGQ